MISKKIEMALNNQVMLEGSSSQYYLAMASWAETQGLNGVSEFLYEHADEERQHMMKLIRFINERGGHAIIPEFAKPPASFKSLKDIFESILKHEVTVTKDINEIVHMCLKEKDYTTHNFLQWFVSEQIEEEALARTIIDKLNLIGNDKAGLYLFDRDMAQMQGHGDS